MRGGVPAEAAGAIHDDGESCHELVEAGQMRRKTDAGFRFGLRFYLGEYLAHFRHSLLAGR